MMSIKYRSRIFRKPFHWSEERYEKFLKENKMFRSREELNDVLEVKDD